jgi:hypothetical protein
MKNEKKMREYQKSKSGMGNFITRFELGRPYLEKPF